MERSAIDYYPHTGLLSGRLLCETAKTSSKHKIIIQGGSTCMFGDDGLMGTYELYHLTGKEHREHVEKWHLSA